MGPVHLGWLLPMVAAAGLVGSIATSAGAAPTAHERWVQRYDGPTHARDIGNSVLVSPDGRTVFVMGITRGSGVGYDFLTIAYDRATGAERWVDTYDGPAGGSDVTDDMALSPDGSTLYVTGQAELETYDYLTIAYDVATGHRRWIASYDGPTHVADAALGVVVSPDGGRVYVTGEIKCCDATEFVTIAYDSATGGQVWLTAYDAPGSKIDPRIGITPDGETIAITGRSTDDFVTVAYRAATGKELWVARYNGGSTDWPHAITASLDSTRVFVTGGSVSGSYDYATVAYRTSDGGQEWVARYDGPFHDYDEAYAIGLAPDGTALYVTGRSTDAYHGSYDYATVAYDTGGGAELWSARYHGPGSTGDDQAYDLALNPVRGTVYVTGSSTGRGTGLDYATVAYDPDGRVRWVARLNGSSGGDDVAFGVVVAPSGHRLYVTGYSDGGTSDYDVMTVRYWTSG
jgi:hypothetical protein